MLSIFWGFCVSAYVAKETQEGAPSSVCFPAHVSDFFSFEMTS